MTVRQVGSAAAQDVDHWSWWRLALRTPEKIGSAILPLHPGEFQFGYFRVLDKRERRWVPVGIWPMDGGDAVAFRGDRPVDPLEIFHWCRRYPISFEFYERASSGQGFEDEPPTLIGHNLPDNADPLDALMTEFAGEKEQLEDFLRRPIATQEQADKVAIWIKRIGDIRTRLTEVRDQRTKPLFREWKDAVAAFDRIVDPVEDFYTRAKTQLELWLKAQKAAEEERQRQAREQADRLRREAADSDQMSASERIRLVAAADQAERDAEAKKTSAGRTGARPSPRKIRIGVVVDYARAAAALIALDHRDLKDTIDTLANRAAKANLPFDGMEIREEERAQ